MSNKKKAKRRSIKSKYTIIFAALLAITIISCWLANVLYLGRFYVSRKTNILNETYTFLEINAKNYGYDSNEFKSAFNNLTTRHNLQILILDDDMNVVISNSMNEQGMSDALLSYFFEKLDTGFVLYQGDRYSIARNFDAENQTEYIQLFGLINNGEIIIMRTPISSLRDSAEISNLFLMYIGLLAIVISIIIAYIVSTRITKPILKLSVLSERMAKLDFDAKYDGNDDNEIGLLGERMNVLSETLENTISELKSANIELQKDLDRKNEIDEMRREFLSNVSHELKTPIALIQGYAEGLSDCVNDDEESRNFYCEVIIDEAGKMNRLVKNLMQLNELEFGQNNVTFDRFNIAELISNCISSVDILIKQNDIKFIFEANEPIYVWSDEFLIEQVLTNYVSNAIHYCSGEEKSVKISLEKIDGKVRVNVFNSGSHIPEESLPHIWSKFYKVDKARTREYGGNGVGLSIVKAAMDSLSQNYGVENNDNGVTFWFEVDGSESIN